MDMPIFTGRVVEDLDIAGYLLPWDNARDQPVILRVTGWQPPAWLVPIFSTPEKLEESRAWMPMPDDFGIKRIEDPEEFLSVTRAKERLLVGADPYRHGPSGRVRWWAVVPPE